MAGEKKGNGKRSITTYRAPIGGMGLYIEMEQPIEEIKVTSPEGTKEFYSQGDHVKDSIELFIRRAFDKIWDRKYGGKLAPDIEKYKNPDSERVYDALDLLVSNLSPKMATLQFHAGSMADVEALIQIRQDGNSYRKLTAQEVGELAEFLVNNNQYSIDLRVDDEIRLPSQKLDLFGGTEGETLMLPIHLEDVGKIATIRLVGVPVIDDSKMHFIKIWEDCADTMLHHILEKKKEVIAQTHKELEKRAQEDYAPFELVEKGEGRASAMNGKKGIDIPGRGYQTGSPFEEKLIEINGKYELMLHQPGSVHDNLSFSVGFDMPHPKEIYTDEHMLDISEFSAKLMIAVMDNAVKNLNRIAKEKNLKINSHGFSENDYKVASVFAALYVLSPKFMKRKDAEVGEDDLMYPELRSVTNIDRISTYSGGMLSSPKTGLFHNLHGKKKDIGDLIVSMLTKMDSTAEDYAVDGMIDATVYFTNIVETLRHFANYTLKSDLTDRLDPRAALPHKAVEGIKYLINAGYKEYVSLVAAETLNPKAHVGFVEWYQEHTQPSFGPAKSQGPRTGGNGIQDIVRRGAISNNSDK